MNIEIGKTYHVNHRRKGKFDLLVTAQDDQWVSGVVVQGRAKYISMENWMLGVGCTGTAITLRKELAEFEEADLDEAPVVS